MMNEATRRFALAHADEDVRQLALRGCREAGVDLLLALQQIQGRQTARRKLPSWAQIDDIVYPVHLSMEQCSSEAAARYKAMVVHNAVVGNASERCNSYNKLVDLTGGFGVDIAFMSQSFDEAVYVERDESLCAIAHHNFAVLGATHVSVVNADGVEFLHRLEEHVSMIYLDPARRDNHGGRTYGLADCTPDVLPIMDELLQKADRVMLKLSPMLDWRKAVNDVGRERVEQVHIVSVSGECKELLLVLSANGSPSPRLFCVSDGSSEEFELQPMEPISPIRPIGLIRPIGPIAASLPGLFLYEPNASLMKAGVFTELEHRYGVCALAPNSHLFTSDEPVEGFPGRAFVIEAVSSMNKSELRTKVALLRQANITIRNFPLTVAELRKRLKLGEGGSKYIFATTLASGEKVLIICRKCNLCADNVTDPTPDPSP